MFESVRGDIGYALRWLARSPGFTVVAVASLAIGIGFNTALFSIVDALLLRPLPIERPDRVVDVYTRGSDGDTYATTSYPDFLDFRARNAVFTAMMGYSPAIAAIKSGDQSRMALGEVVTGNYFQVLGVGAAVGRTLLPADDVAGAPRVVANMLLARASGRQKEIGIRMAIATMAGIVAGLAPALQATRPDVISELKGDVAGRRAGRGRWTLGDGLVALQTAVTLVLLVAAGLLTRSIMQAQHVNLGFKPDGLVAVQREGHEEAKVAKRTRRRSVTSQLDCACR